ncbi:MAG: o-succinylbenzoate synthase [Bacteroides sp.]|nr:o-succinylbenzoate synthase [Roseburia sp.]MCM1346172.1 o-succinylbenzoate synthase [Bacteroides sp.]MCM1420975.1 o-succinylbenzoate synthase [Bacteroides sp.]
MFKFKIIPHTLHFKQPAGTSRGIYTERNVWYVELSDTEHPARKGIGECAPLHDLSCDYTADYGHILNTFAQQAEKELVMDAQGNVRLSPQTTEDMRRFPSMLMGFETAVWHYSTGSQKLSHTAFASGKSGIRINGLVWMGTFEEMKARIEDKLEKGYKCVKLKIGAIDFDDELALLTMIRKHYSQDTVELRVDANGAFRPGDDAEEKLRRLSRLDIHSIEQPIRAGNYEAMRQLCLHTPIPIALDEELIGINADCHNTSGGKPEMTKTELLNHISPQYIVLKPSLHGGFHGAEEWIRHAEARHIGWWVTSALESNVGLNAIAHWCAMLHEGQSFTDISCSNSNVLLPQGLGTGQLFTDNIEGYPLEIREDKLWFDNNKHIDPQPRI